MLVWVSRQASLQCIYLLDNIKICERRPADRGRPTGRWMARYKIRAKLLHLMENGKNILIICHEIFFSYPKSKTFCALCWNCEVRVKNTSYPVLSVIFGLGIRGSCPRSDSDTRPSKKRQCTCVHNTAAVFFIPLIIFYMNIYLFLYCFVNFVYKRSDPEKLFRIRIWIRHRAKKFPLWPDSGPQQCSDLFFFAKTVLRNYRKTKKSLECPSQPIKKLSHKRALNIRSMFSPRRNLLSYTYIRLHYLYASSCMHSCSVLKTADFLCRELAPFRYNFL